MGRGEVIPKYKYIEFIRYLLSNHFTAAIKAAKKMYRERMTSNEQKSSKALCDNGVGFNKIDTPIMIEIARKAISKKNFNLADRLMIQKTMAKYSRQIFDMSDKTKLAEFYKEHAHLMEKTNGSRKASKS